MGAALRVIPHGCYVVPNEAHDYSVGHYPRAVFDSLKRRANRLGQCYPLIKTIARDCEFSVSTVVRALRYLRSIGWVTVQKVRCDFGPRRQGWRNLYTLARALRKPPQKAPKKSRVSKGGFGLVEQQQGVGSSCITPVVGSSTVFPGITPVVSKEPPAPSAGQVSSSPQDELQRPQAGGAEMGASNLPVPIVPERPVAARRGDGPPGFLQFWAVWPAVRRRERQTALEIWKRDHLESMTGEIVEAVIKQRRTLDWLKNGGQFIPYPHRWLRKKRWTDETPVFGGTVTLSDTTLHNMQVVAEALAHGPTLFAAEEARRAENEARYEAEAQERMLAERQAKAEAREAYLRRLQDTNGRG